MTDTKPPADRSFENELLRNPLVRYLARAALTGGTAQMIAQEFYSLGAALTPQGTRH
jgi:hypothetical protein